VASDKDIQYTMQHIILIILVVLTVVDGFFLVSRICNSKHNLHLASHDDNDNTQLFPEQLNIIYDSKCSVCQWEVDYLQSQMDKYFADTEPLMRFTDLELGDYDENDPVNGGVTYEMGMRSFHAVKQNGEVLHGVPVFREAYEIIDQGWVWSVTKIPIIGKLASFGYDIFASIRTQLTRGSSVEDLIEKHYQLKSEQEVCKPCQEDKKNLESSWLTTFSNGIQTWTSESKTISVVCDSDKEETTSRTSKVDIEIISLKHPILILSGATPGPFYHSHPHVSTEFDHLDFSMEEQVKSNIEVIRKIANTVQEYNRDGLLPFSLPLPPSDSSDMNYFKGIESPKLIHWISNDKEDTNYPCGCSDYQSRLQVVNDATDKSCRDNSMDSYNVLENYEVGNNVSDRRFRLETFAMFGIEEGTKTNGEHTFVQLDMRDILDPQYFMPYVPAYAITGGKLAMFTVTSNSGGKSSKQADVDQVKLAYDNMISVLSKLDATFDNVVMLWNRVKDLDKNERSVLMTRSEIMGWDRPLAESVLEINGVNDTIQGIDERTGEQLYIELIVVAQLPS